MQETWIQSQPGANFSQLKNYRCLMNLMYYISLYYSSSVYSEVGRFQCSITMSEIFCTGLAYCFLGVAILAFTDLSLNEKGLLWASIAFLWDMSFVALDLPM